MYKKDDQFVVICRCKQVRYTRKCKPAWHHKLL